MRLWDLQTRQPVYTVEDMESWVSFAVFSPDGSKLTTQGAKIKVRDADTGAVLVQGADPGSMAQTPDGKVAATSNSYERTVSIWDVDTGSE